MGAYIVQDDKPVAFWTRKLNDAQLKYTLGYKELLFIVMVLNEFCTMLLGAVLHIHTDHINITTNNKMPDRIIWYWAIQPVYTLHPWQRQYHCWHTLLAWLPARICPFKRQTSFYSQRFYLLGMVFANDLSSLNASYIYNPWKFRKQTQPIINGYLANKIKLLNYSNNVKKFQIDISMKYLMTKKLFVMLRLVMTAIQNENLP